MIPGKPDPMFVPTGLRVGLIAMVDTRKEQERRAGFDRLVAAGL